jgi:mono/diheme cytochrome c family protein
MSRRGWVVGALAAVALVEGGALGILGLRSRWRAEARGSAVERGQAVAVRMGCFGCHGPGGVAGIPNPGAKGGEVPTWSGGTWMMYNDSPADVRAWILDGHPPGREPDAKALLAMPAYKGRLQGEETDDLVAYVLAVSHFGNIEDGKASAGRDAAARLGCFGCHGPEGRGLVWDPGSLKGYVPPWDGADFAELVRDDRELREWVRNGVSERLRRNPAARHFLTAEVIHMPAFGPRVSDADLDALVAYVHWVRTHPRTGRVGGAR